MSETFCFEFNTLKQHRFNHIRIAHENLYYILLMYQCFSATRRTHTHTHTHKLAES